MYAKTELKASNTESYDYEAAALIEYIFGLSRTSLIIRYDHEITDNGLKERFLDCIQRRKNGEPLQYIMGYTDFYGRRFFVGQGVLIPRFDTEILIDTALTALETVKSPVIIDLCSGSGAIAVTLYKEIEHCEMYAVELSVDACKYLDVNIDVNTADGIKVINDDIFTCYTQFEDNSFDAIVSNPPYIKTNEIPTLQRETSYEPQMSLDGGDDGMDYYRAIIKHWSPKLKQNGLLAFEIDDGQQDTLKTLLINAGYKNIKTQIDLQGLTRVISAIKK